MGEIFGYNSNLKKFEFGVLIARIVWMAAGFGIGYATKLGDKTPLKAKPKQSALTSNESAINLRLS